MISRSEQLYQEACTLFPGGVNSPVRAFKHVDEFPRFIQRAEQAYLFDEDGRRYIDYVCAWGAMILGHAHSAIITAVQNASKNGLSFGACTAVENQLAQKIKALMPSLEKIRFTNSGTEATMTALRLARAVTGRDKIIKFEGCYHGHEDALLVKAGSGTLTFGIPSSAGVPASLAEHTLTARFNHLEEVEKIFHHYPQAIAAVIVEPIAANMNCIFPIDDFLKKLRELCDRHQSLLIFDEVITGFRVAKGGAQKLFNIKPDLTCLGKIIGGGLPVGALGRGEEIMNHLAPQGPVYQAGTLSGNPMSMHSGLAALSALDDSEFYDALHQKTSILMEGLIQCARRNGIPFTVCYQGGLFGLFFQDHLPKHLGEIDKKHEERFKMFFKHMLTQGIYLAPSAYESGFVSAAHSETDFETTWQAAELAFQRMK